MSTSLIAVCKYINSLRSGILYVLFSSVSPAPRTVPHVLSHAMNSCLMKKQILLIRFILRIYLGAEAFCPF